MSLPFGFGPADPHDPRNPAGGFDAASLGAMLQQLGAMLQAGSAPGSDGGPVNWAMVLDGARKQVAQAGDPSVGEADRRAVEESVRLADIWLDAAVTLPSVASMPGAWSRSEWLEATMPVWKQVVAPIAEQATGLSLGGGPPDDINEQLQNLPESMRAMLPDSPELAAMIAPMMGMVQQLGAAAFSMQLGQALAALASDVLGASDIGIPLTATPQVALVVRNVAAFSEGLSVPIDDVRLYLALRESAHQRLFAHVPWLRPRIIGAVEEYARGIRVDQDRIADAMSGVDVSNPEALQNVLASGVLQPEDTEEQRAALARLETLLALIEGWVDDVVTSAIDGRLASTSALQETMRRRRAAGGPAEKTFSTLVGMELRPRLLREASELFAIVGDRGGATERDALWAHPDLLPGPEDLQDPRGFVDGTTMDFPFDDDQPPAT